MLPTIIIFILTYILIATEKVDKTVAAVLGAVLVVALQPMLSEDTTPKNEVVAAEFHLQASSNQIDDTSTKERIALRVERLLHHIDLEVIFLLIGMMVIVNILSLSGIFEWIAIGIARAAKGNGPLVVLSLLVVTAVLSALLDNVTTVILIAPITILVTQILEIPTVPILILEAIFSNIGGTATLVGDPPNIIIGSQTGYSFTDFLINLGPVVVVIMIVLLTVIYFLFRKQLVVGKAAKARIAKAEPSRAIVRPDILKPALAVFSLVILGFLFARQINLTPGFIALGGAMLMLLATKVSPHWGIEKVEWNTILFFVGLFVLVGSLEVVGVFEKLGAGIVALTAGNLLMTTFTILWVSAIFSALVDNIPLVIAMIPLIKSIIPTFVATVPHLAPEAAYAYASQPLFWALALGACLGGNGSLVGASANVIIAQLARRNKYKLSFGHFTKYGLPIMVVSLLLCTLYLYLKFF